MPLFPSSSKSVARASMEARTWVAVVSWMLGLLVVSVVVLDVWAIINNKGATDTISAHLRNWNANTGGVLALVSLALWIHLFVRLPFTWTEASARPLVASSYTSALPAPSAPSA